MIASSERTIDKTLAYVATLQDEEILHCIVLAWPYILSRCRQGLKQTHLDYGECRDLHYVLNE